jgi:light-regulated signal transduction histidine kinase (bacteriophytochrome)
MDKARNLSARVTSAAESVFAANNRAIAVEVQRSRYRLFFAAALLFCLTLGGAVLLTYEVRRETALARGLEASEKRYRELSASLEEQVKERARHLETVNKALDAFSYSVSHDLRAPLRSIDGFSAMALEDYSDRLDDAGRDMLKRIRAAAGRMGKPIQSLLEMSRFSAGELQRERVSISSLAQSILEDLRAVSPDRKSEIQIAPDLAAVGDPILLRLILENLLSNAWKFSSNREVTRIEVGTLNAEGSMAFFVRDNGAGFEPDLADRLFIPMQRLHANAEFEGTGIGLATVQRAVIRMGGRI